MQSQNYPTLEMKQRLLYTGSLSTALKAEQEIMCGNVCINGAHYSIELPHGGKNLNDLQNLPD